LNNSWAVDRGAQASTCAARAGRTETRPLSHLVYLPLPNESVRNALTWFSS